MAKRAFKTFPNILIESHNIDGMLDFAHLFGRSAPVEMEVGSGKGTFLLAESKAFPEKNFLGIEWANKYYKSAIDRLGRWNIQNVRMIRIDAADFITGHVPDNSVQTFHLYFPDPWPKKKHHKRRFFCDENMVQLLRILELQGTINIATDHAGYFEQMTDVSGRAIEQGHFRVIEFKRPAAAKEAELVGTNYERKYIKQGRKTYTLALQKI